VETWEWDKVGLEFVHVDVQFTIESKRGGHRGDHFRDDSVQLVVAEGLNVQFALTNFVQGLIIEDQ
jgi:hypothetical protein